MARLAMHGFEIGTSATLTPEGTPTGTVTRDTGTFRSGVAAAKCDSGAGNAAAYIQPNALTTFTNFGPAASTTYYLRGYFNFTALPGTATRIAEYGFGAASALGISARLTTGGKLQFWNNDAGTQIGSDSSATIATATWYRVEMSATFNGSSNVTDCELRLDGTTVASTSGLTLTSVTNVVIGWTSAPGANKVCYLDDFALNDNSGANQNTWLGDGKIVLLKTISDSAVGTSWTDDAASATNIWDAVTNTPPAGIADTTSGSGLHQIRNAGSNSASYDANLTSYTTAGVGALDTVNVLVPLTVTGSPVSTGAKTGSYGIVSNPAITNLAFAHGASTVTNFWAGAAAGTYLGTGWKWEKGTVTHAPSVTLGTSPVARVTITGGTASRIAMVCAMFMYIDYTPFVSTVHIRNPAIDFADPGFV